MYICSICGKEFETKEILAQHHLKCWKEQHPYHQSKSAPCSESISTSVANDDVLNFFNSFKRG